MDLVRNSQMIKACGVVQFTLPSLQIILMLMHRNRAKISVVYFLLRCWRASILRWHLTKVWEFLLMGMIRSKGTHRGMMFIWSIKMIRLTLCFMLSINIENRNFFYRFKNWKITLPKTNNKKFNVYIKNLLSKKEYYLFVKSLILFKII